MFRKIFCAFDFSEAGSGALAGALRIAEREGARLLVVHVLEPGRLDAPRIEEEIGRRIRTIRESVSAQMEADTIPPEFARNVEILVIHGPVALELLHAIEREAPELVVAGPHGAKGFRGLLGNVAEKLVRLSEAPVLLVRQPVVWPPKRILLPVDFSDSTEEALLLAAELHPQVVELFHVVGMPQLAGYPSDAAAGYFPEETKLRDLAERDLISIQTRHPSLPAEIAVEVGFPGEETCRRAKSADADLIVMATQGRTGLARFFVGSVARNVAHHASCNLLSFTAKPFIGYRREALAKAYGDASTASDPAKLTEVMPSP